MDLLVYTLNIRQSNESLAILFEILNLSTLDKEVIFLARDDLVLRSVLQFLDFSLSKHVNFIDVFELSSARIQLGFSSAQLGW